MSEHAVKDPIYPTALYRCIKFYAGITEGNHTLKLEEEKEYSYTCVNLKEQGHSKDKDVVYLHEWSNQNVFQLPVISKAEFDAIDGVYLTKIMDL